MKKQPKPTYKKPVVMSLFDMGVEERQARLDEVPDGTVIYINYIEPFDSEVYGRGARVHFREMPNATLEYTAAVFSPHNVAKLSTVAEKLGISGAMPEGQYLKVTVRKAGKSYRLE